MRKFIPGKARSRSSVSALWTGMSMTYSAVSINVRPAERQQLKLDLATVLSKVSPELRQAALLLQSRTVTQAARDLGVPRSTFRDTYLEPLREFFTAKGINFYIF